MRVLYLGLSLATEFCFVFLTVLLCCFFFLQVLHSHYHSQFRSMPRKEEWCTYDTTIFLSLKNHIGNLKKAMQERKQWTFTAQNGNSTHLQPLFRYLFLMCRTDLSLFLPLQREKKASIRNTDCQLNAWATAGSTMVVLISGKTNTLFVYS